MAQKSLSSEDYDDIAEDNELYRKVMMDEGEEREPVTGSALVVNVDFRKMGKIEGSLSVVFRLGNGEFGLYETRIKSYEENDFIERAGVSKVTDLLGMRFSSSETNPSKLNEPMSIELKGCIPERFDGKDELAYVRMDEKFREVYNRNMDKFSHAKIIDYDISESPPGIQQELVITLTFELPNGGVQSFETIHGSDNPCPVLRRIFSITGVKGSDSLFNLLEAEVPVVYFDSEWVLHFGRRPGIIHKLPFIGEPEVKEIVPFGKTYGHNKTSTRSLYGNRYESVEKIRV